MVSSLWQTPCQALYAFVLFVLLKNHHLINVTGWKEHGLWGMACERAGMGGEQNT